LLGAAIMLAALLGCAVVLAIQGKVAFALGPFVLVWGLLLLPTFFLWTAFVAATYAVTNNRFATYAIGLAVMVITGWAQLRDKMSWAYNWDLWGATRWSDIAPFQLDSVPLTLNRIAAVGLALFFIVITLRFFARRERDATRTADRLRTGNLWRSLASLAPWLAAPVTAIVILAFMVHGGRQGGTARKKEHDYWKKNVLTYRDALVPSIANVDLALDITPSRRSLKSVGTYTLVNLNDKP